MREFMTIAKALSDESRARVMMFLAEGELCVCQIVEMLHLAPSTVSKHMAVLYQARLVESRKDGRWIYYRLAGRGAPSEVRGAIRWVRQCLGDDKQARADAKRLKAVRKMDLDNLCSRYRA